MKFDKVQDVVETAMTAGQLIERLQEFDPNDPVFFTVNYGDYHRTQQALPIEDLETHTTRELRTSAYSESGIAFEECEEEEEFMCPKCEEMWTAPKCPKCKVPTVCEDGETAAEDMDEAYQDIIIIS